MSDKLAYPTIVKAPHEARPWTRMKQILPGSEILIVQEWCRRQDEVIVTKEHRLGLPSGARFVNMEEVGLILSGSFYNCNEEEISSFTIDGQGNLSYAE